MSSLNSFLLDSWKLGWRLGGAVPSHPFLQLNKTTEPVFVQLLRSPGIDSKEIDSARLHRRTLSMRKNKMFGKKI
jgi:hypothetical protein